MRQSCKNLVVAVGFSDAEGNRFVLVGNLDFGCADRKSETLLKTDALLYSAFSTSVARKQLNGNISDTMMNNSTNWRFQNASNIFFNASQSHTSSRKRPVGDTNITCALLFFGLPKHFKDVVLPSIRKYILSVNPGCDVFIHVYNVSSTSNSRNQEKNELLHPDEVNLMKEATTIVFESTADFQKRRNVSLFYKYFPWKDGWIWPTSLENMIKQWHSINHVWNQMANHENHVSEYHPGHKVFQYERVGIFRSDVLYTNNINISEGVAVTSLFNNGKAWMSDRLFYGLREYGEKW
eukprot:CAMPEP_0173074050 /NCGR_PEP_ID=MMETSP1102-20130122/10779_1 /TAXON_ID=49646 /ORGANISM="Geminigera sp., Strain Caron Lab Isolate" /LENGTH=293 /DNA_ID=CAMNT_0013943031 /DNA_START=294 /DNA_END=1173 /DNA_ORIENTATION=-